MFNDWMVVRFINMCRIVERHCWTFLFIIMLIVNKFIWLNF